MKTRFLLPHRCKMFGWILFIPSTLLGFFILIVNNSLPFLDFKLPVFAMIDGEILGKTHFFSIVNTEVMPSLTGILFIIGAILVAFSQEQDEDEYIGKLRLESLVWATYINYGLLFLALAFVWGLTFFTVMTFNMFTLLLFFIIRFHYVLYRQRRTAKLNSNE
jgi:hypothetical protein